MSPTPARKSLDVQPVKGQQKGEKTKAVIVDAALGLATQIGLEGLSIGALAEVTRGVADLGGA
jgi:hypothetical protein